MDNCRKIVVTWTITFIAPVELQIDYYIYNQNIPSRIDQFQTLYLANQRFTSPETRKNIRCSIIHIQPAARVSFSKTDLVWDVCSGTNFSIMVLPQYHSESSLSLPRPIGSTVSAVEVH
ncbi:hypothetical protein M758_2G225800 [Ceratodon purpureus]|nr:hypothetical protein M758_2G225800 [Ceratodon purpureus]